MRMVALLALLAVAARADGPPSRTRTVKDEAGRIEITVPESWQDGERAEGELIHLNAPHGGGHMLIAVREAAQAEVDRQRDRYMEHDAAKYPGAEFQKIADPFFGYRMNDPAKNRVLLRGFVRDGADGIVVTISSRFQAYDAYSAMTIAALASVKMTAAAPGPEAGAASGPSRRLFDRAGRFSFVAPTAWKTITAEEGEALALGLKGTSATATLRVVDEGEMDNPTLLLLAIQGRWKKDYASCTPERVGTTPPALLVRGRKEGWVDYLIAFASGGHGYTLRLAAREGVFEGLQKEADAMAASLVIMGDPYRAPEKLPGDVARERKGYVVHAPGGQDAAVDAIGDAAAAFERDWAKIAPAPTKKGVPLHVVLVPEAAFATEGHGFGEAPAAYDRLACAVVAVAAPEDDKEALARWRGRFGAALAEAALHRDLAVAAPPWLFAGLSACMEAAGRTGEGPAAKHFALLQPLDVEKPTPLPEVLAYAYTDVIGGETLTPLAMSWGYTHMMLFGKGTLRSMYTKWARELAKATRAAPPFELGRYAEAESELKKHVERELKK